MRFFISGNELGANPESRGKVAVFTEYSRVFNN